MENVRLAARHALARRSLGEGEAKAGHTTHDASEGRGRVKTEAPKQDPGGTAGPRRVLPREAAAAFLGYVALTVAFTWPLTRLLASEVPGRPELAVKVHLWQFWWTREALFGPSALLHTPLLYHPHGVSVLTEFGNFLLPLLGGLIQPVAGLPAAYNTVLLLSMAATGLAAYLLGRRFVAGRVACFLGGAAFVFLPYAWTEVANGAAEIAVLFWVPVCLIQADRCLRRPSAVNALLLGAALFASAMSGWYYGLYLAMAAATLLIRRLLTPDARPAATPAGRRRLIGAFGFALALYALLMLPFAVPMLQTGRIRADWKAACTDPTVRAKANVDLVEFAAPWQRGPTDTPRPTDLDHGIAYPFSVFPGCLTLALGALGWRRRNKLPLGYGCLAVLFWMLSLGPWLKIAGRTEFLGIRVPLPAFFLARAWDGFGATIMHSYRAVAVPSLILCLSAAIGFERMRIALNLSRPSAALAAGLAVVLFGFGAADGARLSLPLPRTRAVPPALYARLARTPCEGAVINVPTREHTHIVGEYMLAQTRHRRPIMSGRSFRLRLPSLYGDFLRLLDPAPPGKPDTTEADAVVNRLRKAGFRFVVVHWNLLTGERARRVEAFLASCARRVDGDDTLGVAIYEFAPPSHP